MPLFKYIARTRAGQRVEGTIDVSDKRTALLQIERMGHVPVSVMEGGLAAPAPTKAAPKTAHKPLFKIEPRKKSSRMKLRDVLLFTRELSDLLASGMTLGNALHTLAKRKTNRAQDQIIIELRDEIVQGSSLSDALGKRPDSFSSLYVSMVRAGEASGQLSEVLERLCKHYERVQEAREKVMMALTYPSIVLLVGIGTMIFTMIFVIPRFSAIFAELGSTLPLPTRILIGMSSVMINYSWAIVIGAVASYMFFKKLIHTPAGHLWWDKFKLKVPVVRAIVAANAYANFARTLSTLLANGVQVLQALSIVENTVGNMVIARAIRDARERVTDGATISRPLAEAGAFPTLLTDMLAVGEESGDMSGALEHIGKRYDSELDRSVKIFTTILEPIMILVMALMVGFVAISMLLAVFDLTSGLKA
jgi:type II secretory pathway component PulF